MTAVAIPCWPQDGRPILVVNLPVDDVAEVPSPRRIQRKRTAGWRLPENTVIVDRTTRFGNPFTVADAIEAGHTNPERAVVSHYTAWLDDTGTHYPDVIHTGKRSFDRRWVLANLHLLRGKDLCCPCKVGQPCHADDLLIRANSPEVSR
jgi:hypothetical protein